MQVTIKNDLEPKSGYSWGPPTPVRKGRASQFANCANASVWETATSDPEPIQAVKGYGSTIEGEPLQYHPPAPASGRVANSTELFETLRAAVQKNLTRIQNDSRLEGVQS